MKRKERKVAEVSLGLNGGGHVVEQPKQRFVAANVGDSFAAIKRGRGRPKGSKNKATLAREAIERMTEQGKVGVNDSSLLISDFAQVEEHVSFLSKQYEQKFLKMLANEKSNKLVVLKLYKIQHSLMDLANRIKGIETEAANING